MTATRIVRPATLLAVAGVVVWALAASFLWRTKVPSDLRLPSLDESSLFGAEAVRDGQRFERFFEISWVLATLVALAILVLFLWRGPRLVRSLGLGPVNAGIITGVVMTVALWAASIPFDIASAWWLRRHGISKEGWASILLTPWDSLITGTFFRLVVLALFLLFAKWLGDAWWTAAAATLLVLGIVLQLALPYVARLGSHPVRSPKLAAEIDRLEQREHVGDPTVRIAEVKDSTKSVNAFAIGIGPSRSVFIFDTFFDGRFKPGEVRVVIAHELGHLARWHIWKGIAWGILIGVPTLLAVALVTRRRGGLRNPATVPLALLTLTVVGLAFTPFENIVSRRYEAEADWMALQATRDPGSARGLFTGFVDEDLLDPEPPGWVQFWLGTHPTPLDRVEQAEAWARLHR
jgi:Zn-dependent protease with chaperone function